MHILLSYGEGTILYPIKNMPPIVPADQAAVPCHAEYNEEGQLALHLPEDQTEYCRTVAIPSYDPRKKDFPKSWDFISPFSWLQAVQACVGEKMVFALDDALICQGRFLGRHREGLIWAYGPETLRQYNNIVLLGNVIDPPQVEHRKGISYTNFNRTLTDFLVLAPILDMQGITEGLSEWYYTHGESVEGVSVPPEYQALFKHYLQDAIEYYDS